MKPSIRQGDIPGVQLLWTKQLDVSPSELWPWLSEPASMSRWLAPSVEPRRNGEPGWLLRGVDESGAELVEEARTLVSEPARLWVAVFEQLDDHWESATRLTMRIEGAGPCELSVLQQGFERLNLTRCLTIWEFYRRRWRAAFERLEAALAAA